MTSIFDLMTSIFDTYSLIILLLQRFINYYILKYWTLDIYKKGKVREQRINREYETEVGDINVYQCF